MEVASVPPILRLDVAGNPIEWIPWQDAACLYVKNQIAWEVGQTTFTVYGGTSRFTGERSLLRLNSIISVYGDVHFHKHYAHIPALSNRELFRRDGQLCMYCGASFSDGELTRDHIIPRSQGGEDKWSNVVCACRRCNTYKGGRTPEEANMPLLAIPFAPNPAEYLALKNRRILADQMDFLKKQFRNDRLIELMG